MFGNLTFSSSDVLKGFARLGSIFDPCEDDLELFEKFLLNLCCKNKVPSSIQTLAELGSFKTRELVGRKSILRWEIKLS